MKYCIYLFSLLTVVAISSCGGESQKEAVEEKKKEEKKVDSVALPEKDTLYLSVDYKHPYPDFLSQKEKESFRSLLGDSLSARLFTLHLAYDSILTQKQMMLYFSAVNEFKADASQRLIDQNASEEIRKKALAAVADVPKDEYFDELRISLDYILKELEEPGSKYLHGMVVTCVAECTEPNINLYLNPLLEKAKSTVGEDDDQFFQLIIDYYTGESEPNTLNAKWFQATWDYGGMSLLGKGHHLAFLKATDELIEAKNLFSQWIGNYRQDCFSDVSQWKSYAYDKKKILAEINKILKEIKLTASQKEALRARKIEVEEHHGNSSDGTGLQLNCETGDCAFG